METEMPRKDGLNYNNFLKFIKSIGRQWNCSAVRYRQCVFYLGASFSAATDGRCRSADIWTWQLADNTVRHDAGAEAGL